MGRIGVFVCHCGKNIASVVNIKQVVETLKEDPDIAYCTDYLYMCSQPGQSLLKETIKNEDLDRIVVAACSRHMHQVTFRNAAAEAGVNPYLVDMANIREYDSWVHHDKVKATEKAIKLIRAVVEEVKDAKPLVPTEVPVTRKALVVGGGVAGIQAALDLANAGQQVILVEKDSTIGGNMAKLSETFPTLDCSQCILTPKMVEVARHPNITLLTNSEITEITGFVGSFKVKIHKKPRYVDEDKCTVCGDCEKVCPVIVPNDYDENMAPRKAIYIKYPQAVPAAYIIDEENCLGLSPLICGKCAEACDAKAIDFDMKHEIIEEEVGTIIVATGFERYEVEKIGEYGYGIIPDVITGLEFERLMSASGPTGGVVRRPSDGKIPKKVAFIHCAGSRDPAKHLPYCSKICCMYATKQALLYKHAVPDGVAINLYIDIRTAGKDYEEFYQRAAEEEGVIYVRGKVSELQRVNDKVLIKGVNTLLGEPFEMEVDMVVLAHGIVPSKGTKEIANILKLSIDANGFLKEAHPKLRPVDSSLAGVFIAGAASGPKDIPESVSNASGAAAKALELLSKDYITRDPIIAEIDNETCGVCMTCVYICPYSAIYKEAHTNKIRVNEALCEGCGACAAACPSGSIELRNSRYETISKEIKILLRSD